MEQMKCLIEPPVQKTSDAVVIEQMLDWFPHSWKVPILKARIHTEHGNCCQNDDKATEAPKEFLNEGSEWCIPSQKVKPSVYKSGNGQGI